VHLLPQIVFFTAYANVLELETLQYVIEVFKNFDLFIDIFSEVSLNGAADRLSISKLFDDHLMLFLRFLLPILDRSYQIIREFFSLCSHFRP